jgi:hypothetical protein
VVNIEVTNAGGKAVEDPSHLRWRITADLDPGLHRWELRNSEVLANSEQQSDGVAVAMSRMFEFQLPLRLLRVEHGGAIYLRFSLWRDGLPMDALPIEGAVQLPVVSEDEMQGDVYNYGVSS